MTKKIPCVQSLETRIAMLERHNRLMKRGVAIISVILAIVTVISCQNSHPEQQKQNSTTTTRTIQAERFVLIGPDGKIRAELSLRETPFRGEGACLTIHDAEGNERLAIGVGANGPFAGPFFEMYGTKRQSTGREGM